MKGRIFYDLHAHSFLSCGADSPTRLILHAKRLGWHGLAITDYYPININLFEKIKTIVKENFKNFNLIFGVEIKTEKISDLKTAVKELRPIVDVILVNTNDSAVARIAARDSRVDILAQDNLRKEKLDPVLFKLAAKSNICFEINLRSLLQTQGISRIQLLKLIHQEIQYVRRFQVKTIITSGAYSWLDLRTPREVIALAKCLGLTKEEALSAISTIPYDIISSNRKRREPGFIAEGVRVVKEGTK